MRRFISLLMIGLLVFITTASTSCDRTETPVETKNDKTDIYQDEDFVSQLEEIQLYMSWVDKVEPYVTRHQDMTYSVDWSGFYTSIDKNNLTGQDKKILDDLEKSVPIANENILNSGNKAIPNSTQSIYEVWYWWGKKLCFTGDDAIYGSTGFANAGWVINKLGVPGVVLGAYIGWAQILTYQCGGFCLVSSWLYPATVWVYCP